MDKAEQWAKRILEAHADSLSFIMACKIEVMKKEKDPDELFHRIHQILINSGRREIADSFNSHVFKNQ